ncbi:MAG TPA: hypothetical protein VF331_14370 [Polyangiales bacterium]
MRSSNERRVLFAFALLAVNALALSAQAQPSAQGFAVNRLYPSAAGAGWLVMDSLDMHGGLGGAMSFTAGYANHPLRVSQGAQQLSVVSDQTLVAFGFAATYERFRLSLNLDAPLISHGQSGTVGGYKLAAPLLGLGSHPDILSDPRVGLDARIFGSAASPLRLGVGAQLIIPNGERVHYDTDHTYRAMARALVAGDLGMFTYAGQLGVHVRPLDDSPIPGSPRGSELLFGVAGGARLPLGTSRSAALIVGPEIYGATAFRSLLGSNATALEGLLTGRIEGTADDGPQPRVKLGVGAGLNPHFGAAEWRVVLAVELFGRNTARN